MPGVILHEKTVAGSCTITSRVGPQDWNSNHNQLLTLQGNTLGASTISGSNIQLSGGPNITLSVNGQTIGIVGVGGGGLSSHDSVYHSGNVLPGVNQNLGSAYLDLGEITSPATPGAGAARVFAYDRYGRNVLRYRTPGGNEFQLAQDNVAVVRNQTGSPITAFTPVYEVGTGAGGEPLVAPADAASETTMPAIGITVESIADSANGFIMLFGVLTGVNTSGFSIGDVIYVAVGGGLTTTAPVIPNISQRVARILTSAVSGTALVLNRAERNTHKGTIEDDWIIGNGTTGSKRILLRGPTDYAVVVSHTAARTVNLPDASGTLVLESQITNFLTTAALSNHSHGNPSLALTNLSGTTASNSAGLTLSLSAAAPGAGGGVAISASNSLWSSGTVTFTGSRNITVGTAAGQIVFTGPDLTPYLTTAALSGHSHGNPSLALTNLTGTTASNSAGLTLSLSAAAPGGGGGVAISASNSLWSSGTVTLTGSRNITVGTGVGQIVITGPDLTPFLTTAALSAHSHGNPSLALTNLTGTTASNSAGFTLSLSAAAGGAGGNQTFSVNGLSSVTGSAVQVVFSNVTNVTLLQTTNGASMTLGFSGNAPGGGAGKTYDRFNPFDEAEAIAGQIGQGTLHLHPVVFPDLQFDRVGFRVLHSNATGSTGSLTLSLWIGLYTKNASTLSLWGSSSTTQGFTFSGTVRASLMAGPRVMTMGWTTTVPADEYAVGIVSRTTSGGANCTLSQFVMTQMASAFSGILGAASATSNQRRFLQGIWTATTSGMPSSIAITQIQGTTSVHHRPPLHFYLSGTV